MGKNIDQIFYTYYSPLCNYAWKIIGNKDDAEDLVQAFFIQFIQNKNQKDIQLTEAYLIKSIKYKCIDFLRSQKNKFETHALPEHLSILPHEITEDEIEPLFYYYAAKLPPKTREVFLLSRVSKLTYKEIAEELNVSQKTVENQMGSALKKLKVLLNEEHYFLLI